MEAPLSQRDSSCFPSTYSPSTCNTSDIIPFIPGISIPVSQEELAKMLDLSLISHNPTTVDFQTEEASLLDKLPFALPVLPKPSPTTQEFYCHIESSLEHEYSEWVFRWSQCPHLSKMSLNFLLCVTSVVILGYRRTR